MPTKIHQFRYPAAIIVWADAHARNQAVEYEESELIQQHRPEICTILALVAKDDVEGITLYNEETGPTSVRGVSFIPRAMVKSVTYVKLTKKLVGKLLSVPSSALPSPDPTTQP